MERGPAYSVMNKIVISRERYQEDLARGYTVREFRIKSSVMKRDLFTGELTEVRRAPLLVYQCMTCQFNSDDETLTQKHVSIGKHPWSYPPGGTPYGPRHLVRLEQENKNAFDCIGSDGDAVSDRG